MVCEVVFFHILSVQYGSTKETALGESAVQEKFDTKKFLERWKGRKDKQEWLFAIAVVKVGLEREGHLDEAAEQEIRQALGEFNISAEELEAYLQNNRDKLLRFLDASPRRP
ncbi:MAG: hypothetical protein C4532_13585 [Candidatus Abyssobacteria bacterium SURF_17]|jgi:hypothetical protein|uniref:Uncharacterized protein n=1 Tax=Candidatus Abyssobacteria bacterium SURF_17 TaxID=2093361 RepID=A0A419EUR3_9BACT|nr:MAG: hypothetical protein C4532_13585 [Candidatus Abyssubacteria bacterium SURF_17]